jgi:hypothetical protein
MQIILKLVLICTKKQGNLYAVWVLYSEVRTGIIPWCNVLLYQQWLMKNTHYTFSDLCITNSVALLLLHPFTYYFTPSIILLPTHQFIHSFTSKHDPWKRTLVQLLTRKNSDIPIFCMELPVNSRYRVALYLTVQGQTLMQRTSHIFRAWGDPWSCR